MKPHAPKLTKDKRTELVDLVCEMQAGWKSQRVITACLREVHGLTDSQVKTVLEQAQERWNEPVPPPGKVRHLEALGRLAAAAEASGNVSAAVRALAEMAKIEGLYSAQKVQVEAASNVQDARLAELLAKYDPK